MKGRYRVDFHFFLKKNLILLILQNYFYRLDAQCITLEAGSPLVMDIEAIMNVMKWTSQVLKVWDALQD